MTTGSWKKDLLSLACELSVSDTTASCPVLVNGVLPMFSESNVVISHGERHDILQHLHPIEYRHR